MSDFLTIVKIMGAFLGAWVFVSVVAVAVIVPWFRAQARMNAALGQHARRADWLVAAHPVERRTAETR